MSHNEYFDQSSVVDKLTAEDYEMLRTLNGSQYWKHYRGILLKAKEAYFNSVLPMKDPNEMMKHIGIVAGINFAINQLPILVAEHDAKVRKKVADKEGV